jgi:hypothetical protein
MKPNMLIPVLALLIITGCQAEENQAEIRFCADIRSDNPCIGEDSIFRHGNVWAQLLIPPGFKEKDIKVNLYAVSEGERSLIGDREYELDADQVILMDLMFFNTCGNYLVEFVDGKGNLVSERNLEIY